jgi:hypothetical protein
MKSRLSCLPPRLRRNPEAIAYGRAGRCALAALTLAGSLAVIDADAADAPPWMHALVAAPLPAHDDRTSAVLLYAETILTVLPNGKVKRLERKAYRILRPEGAAYGTVRADFDAQTRITNLHAWSIPVTGKDFAVSERDAVQTSYFGVEDGTLISDLRTELLRIPAAVPGSVVGYEKEQDERPYFLADEWDLQDEVPTRETRYTLQLPAGWTYRAVWLNHVEEAPTVSGDAAAQWNLSNVPAVRIEPHMPPWRGIAGRLVIAVVPPTGASGGLQSWREVGSWYTGLVRDRRDPTPDMRQKVAELTRGISNPTDQMRALAAYVQNDIRYVAIELGIGGYQPHAAADVFSHRYGDCKDKATLLSAMLQLIGVESYYVIVNTERGSVTAATPPNLAFNHVILAIRLPDGIDSASAPLMATQPYPGLGRLLFFDPTDELTPFGRLRGPLQANFGVLVAPEGGDLVELPQLPSAANERSRTAKLTLAADGTLSGEVREQRLGDDAAAQRYALRGVAKDTDQIKPLESLLSESLANFKILRARVGNLTQTDAPFEWIYEFQAENYAKHSGELMLVRPRVLGSWTHGFLETKEPREHAVEFDGPERDTDVIEIALPAGYTVDDLPPPVTVNYGFASYESKASVVGRNLRYSRTFEIKELSVPAAKAGDLRELYRAIAQDERSSAVLKLSSAAD